MKKVYRVLLGSRTVPAKHPYYKSLGYMEFSRKDGMAQVVKALRDAGFHVEVTRKQRNVK